MRILTISDIGTGTGAILSGNVNQIRQNLAQKSKDFTSGKIDTKDRGLLARSLREKRRIDSQKIESQNEKSFNVELEKTLTEINSLMTEFLSRKELTDASIDSKVRIETIKQFTSRLEFLLNAKHGDRNVLGGDGAVFDLSKAEWDTSSKKLKNMEWIKLPKNGSTKGVNSSVIKIVEALAELKTNNSPDNFNNAVKPKIESSTSQLTFSLTEVRSRIKENGAKIKSYEGKIVALKEEIKKITNPDIAEFLRTGIQGTLSKLNVANGIEKIYGATENQLIKGY